MINNIERRFEEITKNMERDKYSLMYPFVDCTSINNYKYEGLINYLHNYGFRCFMDVLINKNFIINEFTDDILAKISDFYLDYLMYIDRQSSLDRSLNNKLKEISFNNYKKAHAIYSFEYRMKKEHKKTDTMSLEEQERLIKLTAKDIKKDFFDDNLSGDNQIYIGYIPVGTVRRNENNRYCGNMNVLSIVNQQMMVFKTSPEDHDSYSVNLEFETHFDSLSEAYRYVLNHDYFIFKLERKEGNSGIYYSPYIISSGQFNRSNLLQRSSILDRYSFEQIPVFTKSDDNRSFNEFHKNLTHQYAIGNHDYINEDFVTKIAWYDPEKQKYYIYDGIAGIYQDQNGYNVELDEDYEVYTLSRVIAVKQDLIINKENTAIFLKSDTYDELISNNRVHKKIELMNDRAENKELSYSANADLKRKKDQLATDYKYDDTTVKSIQNTVGNVENEVQANDVNRELNNEKQVDNDDMLERLHSIIDEWNLSYKDEDLISFHTSMKLRDMVILSGLSGTGKSQLVQMYANALGLPKSQMKFLSVSPMWQDDTDLLGYVDINHSVYHPADSGLVDLLIDAQQHTDKLYMVCFDEMNLARVEHYFSQFLSVLEIKDSNQRYIQLYNEDLGQRLYNADKYPSKIKIGDNVFFVGTINTDESTYSISDKVLDRVNVINLDMIPFFNLDFNTLDVKTASMMDEVSVDQFNQWCHTYNKGLTNDMKHFLWDLHQAMNEVHYNLGIGLRTVSRINQYLSYTNADDSEIGHYFDIQLCQRVLTKLRGSEIQLKNLLSQDGEIEALLNKYQNISTFERTRHMISQKEKELNDNGYAM